MYFVDITAAGVHLKYHKFAEEHHKIQSIHTPNPWFKNSLLVFYALFHPQRASELAQSMRTRFFPQGEQRGRGHFGNFSI